MRLCSSSVQLDEDDQLSDEAQWIIFGLGERHIHAKSASNVVSSKLKRNLVGFALPLAFDRAWTNNGLATLVPCLRSHSGSTKLNKKAIRCEVYEKCKNLWIESTNHKRRH